MSEMKQKPRLSFEELFAALLDREELEYQLDADSAPYRALSKSRFDTPEHTIIFGDTLRRLLLFRGTRMALKRKGFQKDVKLIANSTSQQCIDALQSSAGQPGDVRNANMEALANNQKIALELRTALRQVLISTKDVPLTDGYKRNLRHESHNLNIAEGALVVFATFNFADNYSPLLFQLVRGGPGGSVEHIGEDIVCRLTDDAPNMPSLQQMHQLIAQSPRAQAKFFLLMDDIADIYFMGMDYSFIGRHHVQQSFHHRYREDQLASTAIPSLGGYGVAELEPFESQERGFKHGHRKKYAIPKSNEREIIEEFKKHNGTGLHNLLQDLKISAEESLEPSSAARPALHDETETKEKSAASDIVSTLAVDAFEEGMITAAAIMSQFVHEILLNLPPQCLLTLSAGSHAVHRYATCDDVRWESFMEVSQQIGLQSWITAFE